MKHQTPSLESARTDILSCFALVGCLLVFYPGLFFAKSAALMGDHWEQHYPWAFLFSQSLKKFELPFWTPLIHAGFPIAAEGQIGLFYLPNLLLYFFLPVQWAYSYMNVLHFSISGISTFLYSRKMGLRPAGAFMAALIFLFGSGYGGAFYNITSLKTIAWFPLSLFFFERYFQDGKNRCLIGIAVSNALMLLAGYLQVAIFTYGIFGLYMALRIFVIPENRSPNHGRLQIFSALAAAVAGSFLLALPQLILTFQLALLSNRVNLTESYAYIGSLSPLALLTFFFPVLQGMLRGCSLYSGIFSIYLILCTALRKSKREISFFRLWAAMAVISLLLALGQFSPLYVALIKMSHFYSFRIPAKFLVYFCFGMAMLSGLGFDLLIESLAVDKGKLNKVTRYYIHLILIAACGYGLLYYFITAGSSFAARIYRWLIVHFIYGHTGHPHSLEDYFNRFPDILKSVNALITLANPWNIWAIFLILASMGFIFWILKNTHLKLVPLAAFGFLMLDLYVYGAMDIKRDFNTYQTVLRTNPVIEGLKQARQNNKLGRLYGFQSPDKSLPLVPSANILFGVEDIGVYSPFVLTRYYQTVGLLGNINDSNNAVVPAAEFVLARLPLLSFLNVSHVVSGKPLQDTNLRLLVDIPESEAFLYENAMPHSRAHFVSNLEVVPDWETLKQRLMEPGFAPQKILLLEKSEMPDRYDPNTSDRSAPKAQLSPIQTDSDSEEWILEANEPGFFILSVCTYPGWQAWVNDKRVPILPAYGIFQAVRIYGPGRYTIRFRYSPFVAILSSLSIIRDLQRS